MIAGVLWNTCGRSKRFPGTETSDAVLVAVGPGDGVLIEALDAPAVLDLVALDAGMWLDAAPRVTDLGIV